MQTEAERIRRFSRRAALIGLGGGALLTGLVGRLSYLTVFQRDKYRVLAEENRVSLRMISPRRGMIVDRFGKPLALNRLDLRLAMIPEQVADIDETLRTIARFLQLTDTDIARIRHNAARVPPFMPVEIASEVDWDAFSALNVRLPELNGVQPFQGYSRHYPDGPAVGHLLGYVGAPSESQIAKDKDPVLVLPGFKTGKDGIEKALDKRLRGRAGANRVEVNAHGRVVRNLSSKADEPGETIVLSIDQELQRFAAERLKDQSGSVILMAAQTGEILAMASVPAYDPNMFSTGIPRAEWQGLLADDHNPLINKPAQGLYTPGSTLKPMMAIAGLETGLIPDERVLCRGRYRLGNHSFACWRRGGHGVVDMRLAITQSCNVYFYNLARWVGIDALARNARKFGLGETFDLPVPSQKAGVVPDPAWKQEHLKEAWRTAETLNTVIGQGFMLATPLQLAVMAARIASGRRIEPTLVREAGDARPAAPLDIEPEHLAFVREAMSDVVNSGRGTAIGARLRLPGEKMAGKTGTAQVRVISKAERRRGVIRNERLPWHLRDHGLFVCFAPVEAPRYAMAVIIEHGGSGSKAAAPVARDIMTLALKSDPLARRAMVTAAEAAPQAPVLGG